MTTRTIVTSQPDVACDVCDRRLLRGEQPDVFLAAGRRRTVCELCAPRAVQGGWRRETDEQSLGLPALRPRRGRNLLGRLRQVGRASEEAVVAPAIALGEDPQPSSYDFLEGYGGGASAPVAALAREQAPQAPTGGLSETEVPGAREPSMRSAGHDALGAVAPEVADELRRAVEAFNASEHPRRVAGVARSLGAPVVNVRCTEHARSVVAIVIAWELCWYRYEVDLDEIPPEARAVAQGTELGELMQEDRLANAIAGESGALQLSGG
jgi:hypothetical protein